MTDFGAWAVPDLPLVLGGRTYKVRPPSVEASKKILAAAVRAEVKLGIVKGEVPADVQAVLDTIEPGEHPALGDVYQQLVDDGLDPVTIDRMAYYAVFFWARGKEYADALAAILWTPRVEPDAPEGGGSDPKALPTSPRKSGRGTGSGSRSTTTKTGSRSSRTTESRKRS